MHMRAKEKLTKKAFIKNTTLKLKILILEAQRNLRKTLQIPPLLILLMDLLIFVNVFLGS